jgi:hypothetical protein
MKKTDLVGNGTERMDTGDSRLPGVSEVITRTSAQSRTGSVNKSLRRMLRMMAVVLTALMTITACSTDDDDVIGDDDDGGNGGGGGVTGKRLKTILITEASGATGKTEYTYNSDGSLKQTDTYDESSNRTSYTVFTNNSDGTIHKAEIFAEHKMVLVYTYDANKKPLKAVATENYMDVPFSINFTFQNGRQIRQVVTQSSPGVPGYVQMTLDHNYNSNGRRISINETTITGTMQFTRQYTRTYNSDGSLQKTVVGDYDGHPNTGYTHTFIWENGKSTMNEDDFSQY